MKVLVLSIGGGIPGGHVIQAAKTASALSAIGVDVTLAEHAKVDFGGYDVIHSFSAPADVLRRARSEGAAVVVTPIWWSADYVAGSAARTRRKRLEFAVRVGYSVARRGLAETAQRLREKIVRHGLLYELADVLLPNSPAEAEQIRRDCCVSTPMWIVPNAVDETEFLELPKMERSGVAYVGRIEPHKNQLGLIDELRETGIDVTIAGFAHPHHGSYIERCRRSAGSSVTFLVDAERDAILDLYRRSAVHVIPSWFETTGLASLEAAAAGCAVVTTSRGFAHEYFEDLAVYCDPGRKGSIRRAIEQALRSGPPPGLRERILNRYTWADAARETLAGYGLALRAAGRTTR